ncbi:hypothetical protein BKA62DRAFT_757583 [Auriculariales sp. MPI-PUGE-AT-0066]|nr:hypothetical protein BKA62DRAFT_757583 [Auriculariales sp. MPI-PUGE-AT-0066]
MASTNDTAAIVKLEAYLARIGNGVSFELPGHVTFTVAYGIYIALAFWTLYTISEARKWYKRFTPLLQFITINISIARTELGDIETRLQLANQIRSDPKATWYLLGDVLIGWRAFILTQRNYWVAGTLAILWLASAVVGFGWYATYAGPMVSWGISVAFNLIATSIIICIAWKYHKLRQDAGIQQRTLVGRVLAVLVVSGLVYVVFGMRGCLVPEAGGNVIPIGNYRERDLNLLQSLRGQNQIINSMLGTIVGIYPTLITLLALRNHTLSAAGGTSFTFVGRGSTAMDRGLQTSATIQFRIVRPDETEVTHFEQPQSLEDERPDESFADAETKRRSFTMQHTSAFGIELRQMTGLSDSKAT